jgi:heat shock protein HtpX
MHHHFNGLKTAALLGGIFGLLLAIGAVVSGGRYLWVFALFGVVMTAYGYWNSDKIAIKAMRAYPVTPEQQPAMYRIVQELSAKAGQPMPLLFVSPTEAPNAFATGRNPKHAAVCATEGLLRMLDDREIAGVMAHELAHVRHRDILITSVAATIGGAISYLGYMLMWGGGGRDREGGHPLAALAVMILGPLAAGLIQAAISRSREFNADTVGGEIAGDPMALATALEKIHAASRAIPMDVNPAYNSMFIAEPLNAMGESIGNLFQTHPPLEARLLNLIGKESTGLTFRGRWAA